MKEAKAEWIVVDGTYVFSTDPKTKHFSNMESQKKWSLKMSKNLDMEIIHHPPKMRSVVNLIIAMERMKTGMFECRDEDLLSLMLESLVEGEHVETNKQTGKKKNIDVELKRVGLQRFHAWCLIGPSERTVFERRAAPPQEYIKTEESLCIVSDTDNKSLYWVPSNMELNAIILQGGADTCKGN